MNTIHKLPGINNGLWEFEQGEPNTKWSELPFNQELPDFIKKMIDNPNYQASILRGLTDIEEGRTLTLEELFAKLNWLDNE